MAYNLLARPGREIWRRSSSLSLTRRPFLSFPASRFPPAAPGSSSASAQNSVSGQTLALKICSRSLSSYSGGGLNANPSYQIYGENTAFTIKSIMPGFKVVGSKTVVIDNGKKGRLLMEFTPRLSQNGGKFAWDRAIKFALSPEEVGTLLARLSSGQHVEFARQTGQNPQFGFHNDDMGSGSLQKVFRAIPNPNGTFQFTIDYELEGRGGQDPPNPQESHGPLEISFMTGEYQVIKSLMEFAIPRLVGWPQMMDRPLEQLLQNDSMPSPHNYSGGGSGGSVPF